MDKEGQLSSITAEARVWFDAAYVFGRGPDGYLSFHDVLDENQVGGDVEGIQFADPNLEAAVRDAIEKPSGDILPSDVSSLLVLDASSRNISDLQGVEQLTQLRELYLSVNQISNVSPLSGLTQLTSLLLDNNQISDVSPLSGLTRLIDLFLNRNQISDVSPLVDNGLAEGDIVDLRGNPLSDEALTTQIPALQARGVHVGFDEPAVSEPGAIVFADPNLEAAVREAIGKSTGSILPSDVSSLEGLDAEGRNISDLHGIEQLSRLTSIGLAGNQISDVSLLSGLSELTGLFLEDNQISDLSPLSALTQLTVLALSSNQISNVSPLSELTQLTTLRLWDNQISDLSPLIDNAGLGEGDTVDLRGNPLSDEALTTQIPALQARGVQVEFDEPAVSEPGAIVFADPNLEAAVREAIGKPTGSILPSDVSALDSLDAWSRDISDLQGIEQLNQLTTLILWNNQISDVSPLAGLTQLTWLELQSNQISDLSPLSGLTQLKSLFLPGNQISDVSPLSGLAQLSDLGLSENQISDVSPLSGLTQLESLFLSRNQISDVSPLSGLTQIAVLILADNQISDLSPLVANAGLGDGDTVNLVGNPLSDEALTTQIPALQARGVAVELGG